MYANLINIYIRMKFCLLLLKLFIQTVEQALKPNNGWESIRSYFSIIEWLCQGQISLTTGVNEPFPCVMIC